MVETFAETSGVFVVTASLDKNIYLHWLKNGILIGQFGQQDFWSLKDMSVYEKKRPNYVREWFKEKKLKFRAYMTELAKVYT